MDPEKYIKNNAPYNRIAYLLLRVVNLNAPEIFTEIVKLAMTDLNVG